MVALLIISSGFVLAHEGEDSYDHHGMMSGTLWGSTSGIFLMGLFEWLFMALLLIALILFIVWLIKQIQEPKKRRKND